MRGEPQPWSVDSLSAGAAGHPATRRPLPPPPPGPPRHRALAPRLRGALAARRAWVGGAVLLLLFAASNHLAARQPAGLEWSSGTPIQGISAPTRGPTPSKAASRFRLRPPPAAPPTGGMHAFMGVQTSTGEPITYDPCRPVPYVVNERTAPEGAGALVDEAVRTIQDATGLQFVDEGTTDEAAAEQRAPFQPERYGDRWAPVLIAWTDEAEMPTLAGGVAGVGGSIAVTTPRGPEVYVSGMVALDGPQLAPGMGSLFGRSQVRAVILHELGHVVGLDHVDDPSQLMGDTMGPTALQPGDLSGLAQLGAGPCVRRL